MHFVRGETIGGAHRDLVCRFHTWQLHISVALTLVDHHLQFLSYLVSDVLDAPVAVGW